MICRRGGTGRRSCTGLDQLQRVGAKDPRAFGLPLTRPALLGPELEVGIDNRWMVEGKHIQ